METKENKAMDNTTLHAIKTLACFSVVAIHIWLPGKIGAVYQIIARFAVPMFFLISGFYSYNISKSKIQQRIKKIFRLTLISTFFYAAIFIYTLWKENNLQFPFQTFSFTNIIRFIFFNRISDLIGSLATPLWYLYAILYIYIYLYFSNKRLLFRKQVIAILLLLTFIIEFMINDSIFYRNFLFMGIPFFGIGNFLAQIKKRIINCRVINKLLILGMIIYPMLVFFEYYSLGNSFELYISSILAVIMLMLFAIKKPNAIDIGILNEIGEKYTTFIYITHQFVILIFTVLISNTYILKFGTIFVFLICYGLGKLFQFVKQIR
ncbi:hypothetical protein HMPREF9189_1404 [Streptococcus sp. oral taxon 071 str. 73H25AP]|uniref:acyltransferase family protein n=1 Tax=Streptococcus sp. oral taxon 071 TaxID=712630 RepID=UPI0001E103C2|nr:acyltransferase [Streptococcus sp. oral taxon 071]EFM35180.1 hypothetical protein HMPREF9189_1404 [Streptococcus sp. oral taxon 071 str. 73H25AP]